jgi:GNAT superfamily N-acetyltransferase
MVAATDAAYRARIGLVVELREPEAQFLAPGLDQPHLNRAFGFGLDQPLDVRRLDAILARYAQRSIPRWMLQWCPMAMPQMAPDWFAQRSARPVTRMAKWRRDLRIDSDRGVEASPFHVVRISGADRLRFEQVANAPFALTGEDGGIFSAVIGHDGWHHYLALYGDVPVAGAAMCIRGTHAWLGVGATVESHRGRGAQSALIRRRIADAIAAGCTQAYAETTPAEADRPSGSCRNLQRAGFTLLYHRVNYLFTNGGTPERVLA